MHDLTKQLIDKIHAQTLAGQVEWLEGPGKNAYAFEADTHQISVEATTSTAVINISDNDGRDLETLDEEELAAITAANGVDYETIVREIHTHARRVALGTDDAIERIIRAMGDDAPSDGDEARRNWR